MKRLRIIILIFGFVLSGCHATSEDKMLRDLSVKKNEEAATYNTQLGLAYLKQGNRPRAKRKLLAALKLNSSSPEVNSALAYYFEKAGDINEAEKYYAKALSLSSQSGAQLNNYGTFLCRQGNYKKADEYFLKAVQDVHYLNTSGAYENAGLCAVEIHNEEKAKSYFTHALQQDPTRKQSLEELVGINLKQQNHKDVLLLIEQYQQQAVKSEGILRAAITAAEKTQDLALANKYSQKLDELTNFSDKTGGKDDYDNQIG